MLSDYCKAEMESMGQNPEVLKPLENKLLSLGGETFVGCYEEDIDKLVTRGQAFSPKKVKLVKMEMCRCHANSGVFWKNYSDEHGKDSVQIVVGWALSKDQMWRQHSFVYLPKTKTIIETTTMREIYFGFILTNEEAQTHYKNNY